MTHIPCIRAGIEADDRCQMSDIIVQGQSVRVGIILTPQQVHFLSLLFTPSAADIMWTESIPAFAVIIGGMASSGLIIGGIQSLFHSGHTRKHGLDSFSRAMMQRDEAITGKQYAQNADLDFVPSA
ncbi:uncharacterized protein MONBRDRAFT_31552 [Monosiga brevicollis MX1]|uniref:NADH dehydrogenase [ubiquinone] 1 alpha subcomplex subunit 1 n=1 Tax=Monosiga brevicollis TaxID=81824 RepID=A9UTX0_MONBE|nr:uncharacterized protein MONBRDRAFT_31552 [Monosiga brevicollis MX1]EDQ91320.1 predicted protein [Monosiga brevicollis MX1]|eukprot:XP_001743742.1 hypothetical protein [Monosiga brevicollis MX1]